MARAEAEGAASLLLDVQQDCIAARKQLTANDRLLEQARVAIDSLNDQLDSAVEYLEDREGRVEEVLRSDFTVTIQQGKDVIADIEAQQRATDLERYQQDLAENGELSLEEVQQRYEREQAPAQMVPCPCSGEDTPTWCHHCWTKLDDTWAGHGKCRKGCERCNGTGEVPAQEAQGG